MEGGRVDVFFYSPTRLAQDLEADTKAGHPYVAEPGLVVVPEVTLPYMEAAVEQLYRHRATLNTSFTLDRPVEPKTDDWLHAYDVGAHFFDGFGCGFVSRSVPVPREVTGKERDAWWGDFSIDASSTGNQMAGYDPCCRGLHFL